jgi:hypothetical protein
LDLPTNPRVWIVFLCSSHIQPALFIDLSLSIIILLDFVVKFPYIQ